MTKNRMKEKSGRAKLGCGCMKSCPVRQSACAGTSESSEFADFLLATLGKGATSVSGLQTAAMAMVRESGGHCSQLTKKLARIGGAGAFPQNAERDLFRILELPIDSWRLLAMC